MNQFLNPYEVLELTTDDPIELRKAKNKKIAEIEISDDGYIIVKGQRLGKSDILNLAGQLDNEVNKSCYRALLQNNSLNDFLSNGDLSFFEVESNLLKLQQNSTLSNFVGQYFTLSYSKMLFEAFKNNNSFDFNLLTQYNLPLPLQFHDSAYKLLYNFLNENANSIKDLDENLDEADLPNLIKKVKNLISFNLLNRLPAYFDNPRDEIAQSLRYLSVSVFNEHDAINESVGIVELASQVKTTLLVKNKIKEDLTQIKEIQEERILSEQYEPIISKYAGKLLHTQNLFERIKKKSITIGQLKQELSGFADVNELNALPDKLSDFRSQIGLVLRAFSVAIFNDFDDWSFAYELLCLAEKIKLNPESAKSCKEAKASLKQIEQNDLNTLQQILNEIQNNINTALRTHGVTVNSEKVGSILLNLFSEDIAIKFGTYSDFEKMKKIIALFQSILKYTDNRSRKILYNKFNSSLPSSLRFNMPEGSNGGGTYPPPEEPGIPVVFKIVGFVILFIILINMCSK